MLSNLPKVTLLVVRNKVERQTQISSDSKDQDFKYNLSCLFSHKEATLILQGQVAFS